MVCATEKLLPGPAAVEAVTGDRVHYSTYFRWTQLGLIAPNGLRVKLDYAKCGSRRKSSIEAVRRFIAALSEQSGTLPAGTPCIRSEAEHEAAEKELIASGA